MLPLDDYVLAGPKAFALLPPQLLEMAHSEGVDSVLAFPGTIAAAAASVIPYVLNMTVSTTMSSHTAKIKVSSPMDALIAGASAVAVHVNFTDASEAQMLVTFGEIASQAADAALPVVALAYVRRGIAGVDDNYEDLRRTSPSAFADLVTHAVAAAAGLGADVIKAQYTDDASFSDVVAAANGVPVLMAGGPLLPRSEFLRKAEAALMAGCSGLSVGRNVFSSEQPLEVLRDLRSLTQAPANGM